MKGQPGGPTAPPRCAAAPSRCLFYSAPLGHLHLPSLGRSLPLPRRRCRNRMTDFCSCLSLGLPGGPVVAGRRPRRREEGHNFFFLVAASVFPQK